ncbi:hypothetical protein KC865_04860 [Candidatus Kaiserbacteria bacterium]|nr:hypothetical protein [Candidatus Kaiserbacteria bacterium]
MVKGHHATLVRADSVQSEKLLNIESFEINDSYIEKFGIDNARWLVEVACRRPADSGERVFVVRTNFITVEAQNALLKILEEPPLTTKFIFVLPADFTVIPTLLSRFDSVSIEVDKKTPVTQDEIFLKFSKSNYKDRLADIESASKKKDVKWQRAIKQGLIQSINENEVDMALLGELEYLASKLLTRGASNKMLLEHLALTLPIR